MILYRFRPFNQHTITELLTEKLHFFHPNTWNDPFEWDCGTTDVGNRYACFAQNKSKEEDVPYNFLMWSHYADAHKGICIEYEGGKKSCVGTKITYKEQVGLSERGSRMAFYKHQCWEYENEYRMVVGIYEEDFQGVDIPYSEIGLKIKGIYCGVEFEKNQLESLKIISIGRNFEIFTGNHLAGILQYYNSIEFTKTGAVERTLTFTPEILGTATSTLRVYHSTATAIGVNYQA